MGQYESLDFETREGINTKFLHHLEDKGGIQIGQLLEEYVDETESQTVMEHMFPPD